MPIFSFSAQAPDDLDSFLSRLAEFFWFFDGEFAIISSRVIFISNGCPSIF